MNIDILANRATVRGYELRQGIEAFAHKICSALGLQPIRITWQAVSTAAFTDKQEMILAAVKDDAVINRATVVRYVGYVAHELLHHKFTDFYEIPRYEPAGLLRLQNALEDIWIERKGIDMGLTGNIESVLSELVGQIVAESLAEVQDWSDPGVYPFALAVYGRTYAPNVPMADGIQPLFDEALRRLNNSTCTADNVVIARWLWEQLKTEPQTEPQTDDQGDAQDDQGDDRGDDQSDGGQGDQGQDGAQGDGQGDGQPQGQSDEQGDDKGGGASGDAQGDASGNAQGDAEGDAQGEGESQGDTDGTPTDGRSVGNRRAMTDGTECMEVEPTLNGDPDAADDSRDDGQTCKIVAGAAHLRHEARAYTVAASAKLRYEVRRLLDNSAHEAFEPRRRTGAIDTRALARTDGRIFQRRSETEGVDTAVVICVDVSSSMNFPGATPRIEIAAPAAAALADTLHKAQSKVAVVSFSHNVAVNAPFGTPANVVRDRLLKLHAAGATSDFQALRVCTDLLLARREQRKIVLVLTDGKGQEKSVRAQAQAAQALGITVVGIGIQHDVSNIYPQAVQIKDLADLGNSMFKQIKLAA